MHIIYSMKKPNSFSNGLNSSSLRMIFKVMHTVFDLTDIFWKYNSHCQWDIVTLDNTYLNRHNENVENM